MIRPVASAVVLALTLTATAAPAESPTEAAPPAWRSLQGWLGQATAEHLLESKTDADRARAFLLLGELGTPRALTMMANALVPSRAPPEATVRLAAVRALSEHANDPEVRLTLLRLMSGVGAVPGSADPLEARVEASAGLALAANGGDQAYVELGRALRAGGSAARAARLALVAHPPTRLDALVNARGPLTLDLVETLAALDDERSVHALRDIVRRGTPEVRAAAAVTLTRLGHYDTVTLARHWLTKSRNPTMRRAATLILALSHDPTGTREIERLLADPATRADAISLASDSPSPTLARTLAALTRQVPAGSGEFEGLLTALGRAGTPTAWRALVAVAKREPAAAGAALFALSSSADTAPPLTNLLGHPSLAPAAARALVLQARRHGAVPTELRALLERWLGSHDRQQLEIAAWGVATLEPSRAPDLLARRNPAITAGVGRAALSLPESVLIKMAALLDQAKTARDSLVLGAALASDAARDAISTRRLHQLRRSVTPLVPLVTRALVERDDATVRPRLSALLASSSPMLRAHVALGLGRSPLARASGLLRRAYSTEPQPRVREALVAALGQRGDPLARRTLGEALVLDPEERVRTLARWALRDRPVRGRQPGSGVAWIEPTGPGDNASILLWLGPGTAVPLTPDVGGVLALVGLTPGMVDIERIDTRPEL